MAHSAPLSRERNASSYFSYSGDARYKGGEILTLKSAYGYNRWYRVERYLGHGATSDVYLVRETDEEGREKGREAALKLLRPVTAEEWRKAFEDEISVLRSLWEAEENLKDGLHCVPEIYDVSPRNSSPAYMVMEYVSHPPVDKLVEASYDLSSRVGELAARESALQGSIEELLAEARRVGIETASLTALRSVAEEHSRLADALASTREALDRRGPTLAEREIALIGAQMCRLLQLLHQQGRGYKDFQLQNIRWDRQRQQIKVLDWNVVTPPGSVNLDNPSQESLEIVARDLSRLARFLYWMCTWKHAPEEGGTPAELAERGGAPWRDHTSLAFKLVVERALSPREAERFSTAYDFAEVGAPLKAIAEFKSLGAALQMIASWLGEENPLMLVARAAQYRDKGFFPEALALAELVRLRFESIAPEHRDKAREVIRTAEDAASKSVRRPALEAGRRALESLDVRRALAGFVRALEENSHDLEAQRYLAFAKAIEHLSLEDLRRLHVESAGQVLDQIARFASGAASSDAEEELNSIARTYNIDLYALIQDAQLTRTLAKAERYWTFLKECRQQGRLEEMRAYAEQLLQLIAQADKFLEEHGGHPYLAVVAKRFEYDRWREAAKNALEAIQEDPASRDRELKAEAKKQLSEGHPEEALSTLKQILYDDAESRDLLTWARALLVLRRGFAGMANLDTPIADVACVPSIGAGSEKESWNRVLWEIRNRQLEEALGGELLESIKILRGAPLEIRRSAGADLGSKIELALQHQQLALARRLIEVERSLLGDETPDRTQALSDVEQALVQERHNLLESVKASVLALEAKGGSVDNSMATTLVKELLSLSTYEGEKTSLNSMLARLRRQSELLKAGQREEEGDDLIREFSEDNVEQAVQAYRDALRHVENCGEDCRELADRLDRKLAKTESLQKSSSQIVQTMHKVQRQLGFLNNLLADGRHKRVNASPKMGKIARRIADLKRYFEGLPLPKVVEQTESDALNLAMRVGWSQERFWAQVQSVNLDWASQRLLSLPIPEQEDAEALLDLHVTAKIVAAQGSGTNGRIPDEDINRLEKVLEGWLRSRGQELLDSVQRQEFFKSAECISRIGLIYRTLQDLKRIRAPQTVSENASANEALGPALDDARTADDLIAWLRTKSPDEAQVALFEWVQSKDQALRSIYFIEQGFRRVEEQLDEVKQSSSALESIQKKLSELDKQLTEIRQLFSTSVPNKPAEESQPPSPVQPPLPEPKPPGVRKILASRAVRFAAAGLLALVAISAVLVARGMPFTKPPATDVEPSPTVPIATATRPIVVNTSEVPTATVQPSPTLPEASPTPVVVRVVSSLKGIETSVDASQPVSLTLTLYDDSTGNLLQEMVELDVSLPPEAGVVILDPVRSTLSERHYLIEVGDQPGSYTLTIRSDKKVLLQLPVTISPPSYILEGKVATSSLSVVPGATVTYTVEIVNSQPKSAERMEVVCALPPTARFVAAANNGAYDDQGHELVWREQTIPTATPWQVTFELQAPSDAEGQLEAVSCRIRDRWQNDVASFISQPVDVKPVWEITLDLQPLRVYVGDTRPVTVTVQIVDSSAKPVVNAFAVVSFALEPPDVGKFMSPTIALSETNVVRTQLVISPTVTVSQTLTVIAQTPHGQGEGSLELVAVYSKSIVDGLALRRQPKSEAEQIGRFVKDDEFQVLGRSDDGQYLYVRGNAQNSTNDLTRTLKEGWIGVRYAILPEWITVSDLPVRK